MSTFVAVNTYTHSVTFVANNILMCLQDIVRRSGLNPEKIASDWEVLERGLAKWLQTQHLQTVTLEVNDPRMNVLIHRWDFSITYAWSGGSGGGFWVDTDQIRYFILKQGLAPSAADYRIIVDNKPGYPEVLGWGAATYLSTEGFVRQSIGTTMDAAGLGAAATYYRKR
ncbi:MAG TPA: HORMA domain containing protein [Thermoanaerobaculia bacterium]|jgi:hypothetical protein|nr:HORMA domain containing protein [Thermoanaerobaculia bacterium]